MKTLEQKVRERLEEILGKEELERIINKNKPILSENKTKEYKLQTVNEEEINGLYVALLLDELKNVNVEERTFETLKDLGYDNEINNVYAKGNGCCTYINCNDIFEIQIKINFDTGMISKQEVYTKYPLAFTYKEIIAVSEILKEQYEI